MSASPSYVPSPTPDLARIQRALISVSDKEGLIELGKALVAHGVEILSTGGSAKALRDAGVQGGRSLRPHRLSRRSWTAGSRRCSPRSMAAFSARRTDAGRTRRRWPITGSRRIDLVVVNLYPFEATVARGADYATCVENIDIGGPALIRASAKNHDFVTIARRPAGLRRDPRRDRNQQAARPRWRCAASSPPRPIARTASYDSAIANWFAGQQGDTFPERLTMAADACADACATARIRTSRPPSIQRRQQPSRRRHRAHGPGQGAVLQQHRRHRGGL